MQRVECPFAVGTGKSYLVICSNAKEAKRLFDGLCDYLRNSHHTVRVLRAMLTLDFLWSHDQIRFITTSQTIDGYPYDELISGSMVDRFLSEYERSIEAARITCEFYDVL